MKILNDGVPQGTILGPLLYILYINDIDQITNDKNYLTLYADDTNMMTIDTNNDETYKSCQN